jgi:hypothetical protein
VRWLREVLRAIGRLLRAVLGGAAPAGEPGALVATLNVHSGMPNPVWMLPEADWPEFARRLAGPAVPGLRGDAPFTLGCVIVRRFGPAAGMPDRVVAGPDVILVKDTGGETHRRDAHGLFQWLLDSAESAGVKHKP